MTLSVLHNIWVFIPLFYLFPHISTGRYWMHISEYENINNIRFITIIKIIYWIYFLVEFSYSFGCCSYCPDGRCGKAFVKIKMQLLTLERDKMIYNVGRSENTLVTQSTPATDQLCGINPICFWIITMTYYIYPSVQKKNYYYNHDFFWSYERRGKFILLWN